MSVRAILLVLRQIAIGVGATIAVELPSIAHGLDEIHVEIAHDEFGLVGVTDVTDELAFRIDEVARAVEVVVAQPLDADAVDGADVSTRWRRRRGPLELPEVVRQARDVADGLNTRWAR
jgi:hypothetical protein